MKVAAIKVCVHFVIHMMHDSHWYKFTGTYGLFIGQEGICDLFTEGAAQGE